MDDLIEFKYKKPKTRQLVVGDKVEIQSKSFGMDNGKIATVLSVGFATSNIITSGGYKKVRQVRIRVDGSTSTYDPVYLESSLKRISPHS